MMDLNELRSVQSRERQTDSLQQLRESFYQDAGEFIQQLHRERERAADQADDPWDAPEVNRLSDDIDTAEQTVEAIYERRVGKIVKMASLAAADMPTEDEGLTAEEQTLFETLVKAIERNRTNVEAVIDGENPAQAVADAGQAVDSTAAAGSTSASDSTAEASGGGGRTETPTDPAALENEAREPAPRSGRPSSDSSGNESGSADLSDESAVDAADLMGGDGPEATAADATTAPDSTADAAVDDTDTPSTGVDEPVSTEPDAVPAGGTPADGDRDGGISDSDAGAETEPVDETDAADEPAVERATVKITSDIGEIFGVDQRAYDLSPDDVVQLPEANAGPLVDRDAAERLD